MPKQMAIDADLNAGVLSNEEARAKREEITQEADFYGAMDGASKFVKVMRLLHTYSVDQHSWRADHWYRPA